MRRQRSIAGESGTAAIAVSVLIAAAVAIILMAAIQQAAAYPSQLSRRFAVLRASERLSADFTAADLAVSAYTADRTPESLRPFAPARAAYRQDITALTPHTAATRTPVEREARVGAAWFTLASRLISVPPGSPAARALDGRSAALSGAFLTAATRTSQRLRGQIRHLATERSRSLTAALAVSAGLLVLALAVTGRSTLRISRLLPRPLREVTATVRRLTAGRHTPGAPVTGSPEAQPSAGPADAQAGLGDQARDEEAESHRLRSAARAAGIRVREPLDPDTVLAEAVRVLRQTVTCDALYLRLLEGNQLGRVVGEQPGYLVAPPESLRLDDNQLQAVRAALAAQSSLVFQDVTHASTPLISGQMQHFLAGVQVGALAVTPFGVNRDVLGLIVAVRLRTGHPWRLAELDALQSVAADLGRGLHHARLYEAENRLVAQLQEVDRAKSGFLAMVSHELRTPLSNIVGFVEVLADQEPGPLNRPQLQMLDSVARNARRLQALIEELLTLSRVESRSYTSAMQPVDLSKVLASALAAAGPEAADQGVEVSSELTPGLRVYGDRSQLRRAVDSLISNAVKFTPRGGHVDVTTAAEERSAAARITDSGIGIPEADQDKIFDRFFRAANAIRLAAPGSGLGLSIAHMIVHNHGGDIEVRSAEGAGTAVTLRQPLLPAPGQRGEAATAPADRH